MNISQILTNSGGGGGGGGWLASQSRDPTTGLKQTVNGQYTYASLSMSPYSKRPTHTHHLATITTSQELTLKTRAQGNRQGREKFILPKAT